VRPVRGRAPDAVVDPAVKPVLLEVIEAAQLLKQERKLTSKNLALVLVHDLLFAKGIQAGDGPVKQAVLRHKCAALCMGRPSAHLVPGLGFMAS
jgi:hypothetical protein